MGSDKVTVILGQIKSEDNGMNMAVYLDHIDPNNGGYFYLRLSINQASTSGGSHFSEFSFPPCTKSIDDMIYALQEAKKHLKDAGVR